jgi:hypothetical protein
MQHFHVFTGHMLAHRITVYDHLIMFARMAALATCEPAGSRRFRKLPVLTLTHLVSSLSCIAAFLRPHNLLSALTTQHLIWKIMSNSIESNFMKQQSSPYPIS